MESTSTDGIASYYPAIESAIESVSGGKLSVAGVIDKLHIDIVNSFNGECISKYKRDWVRSVMAFAKNKGIDMPTTPKPNWEDIYGMVIDRMLNKSYDFQKFQKPISCKISQASQSSSSTATACTDSSSTSTSTNTESGSESAGVDPQRVKLPALTAADRANILEKYNALDPKKMWRLSNGTVVEERMCKCAMEQQHEHMAHSFILDAKDEGWLKYFTRSELNEISAYKAIQLPEAPEEVVNYLNTLKSDTVEDLTDKVEHQKLPLNSDRKWIQDSYSQCIRLINSGFLPSDKNTTEAGLIKRVWSCIDACFDYSSKIRCISGEKCSKSSADAMNATRWDIKCRQLPGRKMDFVFIDKKTELEIGCGEGALVGGVNTTKQLYDAKFKMPKVLRDMITKLVSRSPALKKDLHVCGFYVAETDLQLFILDCPSTYVTRLDAMKEMHYPKSEGQIHRQLSAVLRNIIGLRIIMENTVYALDHDTTDITIGRDNDEAMIPCFIPSSPEKKKRKLSVATSMNS